MSEPRAEMQLLWFSLLVSVSADQWHIGPDGTRAFWIHRKPAAQLAAGTSIQDVVDYCTALSSSHVFLPRTAAEHSFVTSLVDTSNNCGKYMECGGIFLGMTDEQEEGVWRSLETGEVVYRHSTGVTTAGFYTNWITNEPNDASFQDGSTAECIILNERLSINYDYSYDQSCTANPAIEYLICERKVWHLGPDGTRAFWIHRKPANELAAGTSIQDVVDYCTALSSSHVYLPRTTEEHSFVMSLVDTSNNCGNYMECGGIFLGMTDEQEEGVWRSLGTGEVVYRHSTGVTTAGFYTNWRSNEPGDTSFQDASTAECATWNWLLKIDMDESYDQSCTANPSIEYLICEREVCLQESDPEWEQIFSAPDGRSFVLETEMVTVTCSASEVVLLDGAVQNTNTATVTCSSGQLESTPTCETGWCSKSIPPANGSVAEDAQELTRSATYTCDEGYVLAVDGVQMESHTRTCVTHPNTWSNSGAIICYAPCNKPMEHTGTNITGSDPTPHAQNITYTCATDYNMLVDGAIQAPSSSQTMTCTNGAFPVTPSIECMAPCNKPTEPTGTSITGSDPTPHAQNITYTCATDYTMLVDGVIQAPSSSQTMTCTNGAFPVTPSIECMAPCNKPTEPTGTSITGSDPTPHAQNITYTCATDYTMLVDGVIQAPSSSQTMTCTNGAFPVTPSIECMAPCNKPTEPTGTSITGSDPTPHAQNITYTCATDYTMLVDGAIQAPSSSQTITCTNGAFPVTPSIECMAPCNKPAEPTGTSITGSDPTPHAQNITYTCATDYTMLVDGAIQAPSSSQTMTCTNGAFPVTPSIECMAPCNKPAEPTGTSITGSDPTPHAQNITYTCATDYTMLVDGAIQAPSSSQTMTCTNGAFPVTPSIECMAPCSKPAATSGVNISGSDPTFHGEPVSFTCTTGFTMTVDGVQMTSYSKTCENGEFNIGTVECLEVRPAINISALPETPFEFNIQDLNETENAIQTTIVEHFFGNASNGENTLETLLESSTMSVINQARAMAADALREEYMAGLLSVEQRIEQLREKPLVASCSHDGQKCSEGLMKYEFVNYEYNVCARVNSDGTAVAKRPGAGHGFRFLLNIDIDEYLYTSDKVGAVIFVHNHTTYPFPEISGLNLSPGKSYAVEMRQIKIIRAINCRTDTENSLYSEKYSYSMDACLNSCSQRIANSKCGCTLADLPYVDRGLPFCDPKTDKCAYNAYSNTSICGCLDPCTEYNYDVTISSANWPVRGVSLVQQECANLTGLGFDQCLSRIRDTRIVLDINYRTLSTEEIWEVPVIPLSKLFNELANSSGLWTGDAFPHVESLLASEQNEHVSTSYNTSLLVSISADQWHIGPDGTRAFWIHRKPANELAAGTSIQDVVDYCTALSSSHMFLPRTAEEHSFVTSLVDTSNNCGNYMECGGIFLGMTDAQEEGVWRSLETGEVVYRHSTGVTTAGFYTNWNDQQPDDITFGQDGSTGTAECVVVNGRLSTTYNLVDQGCTANPSIEYLICEHEVCLQDSDPDWEQIFSAPEARSFVLETEMVTVTCSASEVVLLDGVVKNSNTANVTCSSGQLESTPTCQNGWHLGPDGTRAFWIHRKPANELAAGTSIQDVVVCCTALSSSHMFLPRTAEEHSFVMSLVDVSNNCGLYAECAGIFLGMTDEQEEGVWRSLETGEVVYRHSTGVTTAGFYTNWKSNEPGDSSFQDASTAECATWNGIIKIDFNESYDQSCTANPSIEYLICERDDVCLRSSDPAWQETFSAPDGRSFAFETEAVTVTCSASEVVLLDGAVQNTNTANVTCSSGQLESTPTCETGWCSKSIPPANGSVAEDAQELTRSATFTCDEGYVLTVDGVQMESHTRTCVTHPNTWSNSGVIICYAPCNKPTEPTGTNITGSNPTLHAQNITYTCATDYTMLVDGAIQAPSSSQTMTCTNGEFPVTPSIECMAPCNNPTEPTGTSITGSDPTPHAQNITYTCATDYTMLVDGVIQAPSSSQTMTCTNGAFPVTPSIECMAPCNKPTEPTGASITGSNPTPHAQDITYTCATDYTMLVDGAIQAPSSSKTTTCTNGAFPVTPLIECMAPCSKPAATSGVNVSGSNPTLHGEPVSFTCATGFTMTVDGVQMTSYSKTCENGEFNIGTVECLVRPAINISALPETPFEFNIQDLNETENVLQTTIVEHFFGNASSGENTLETLVESSTMSVINQARAMAADTLREEYMAGLLSVEQRIEQLREKPLVASCSHDGQKCSDGLMKYEFVNYEYNVCARVNSDGTAVAKRPGAGHGFRFILNIDIDEYLYTSDKVGAVIFVHNHTTYPFPEISGLNLSPGKSYAVEMRQIKIIRAINCRTDTENSLYSEKYSYSMDACLNSCSQRIANSKCGCTLADLPYVDRGLPFCDPKTDKCAYNAYSNTSICGCLAPCTEYNYDVTISSANWPVRGVSLVQQECANLTGLGFDQCLSRIRDTRIVLDINYRTLSTEEIWEVPVIPLSKLFNELANSSGLWTGVSVLSTLEICLCIFIGCISTCGKLVSE